jgi:transposase
MLEDIVKKGEAPARKIMHAHILLKTDSGKYGPRCSSEQIQAALGIGKTVIQTVRQRFTDNGIEDALERRPQPRRPYKLKINGEQEAKIVAFLCTERPEGQERWTMRALTDRLIELEIVDDVSHETVRQVLKKMNLNLG